MKNLMFKNFIVEMILLNGEPLFNPYHVGMCLGLSDSTVRDHVAKMNERQVVKLKNSIVDGNGIRKLHNTGENFLTERGVYKLVFKSRKEEAEQFQDWIADEVLPQIRETGRYITEKEKLLLDLFHEDKRKVTQAYNRLVEIETAPLIQQIEEQAPAVAFAKAIEDTGDCISVAELATILRQNGIDTGEKRLFAWLRDNSYLANIGDRKNLPTQRSVELGVLRTVERPYINPRGEKALSKKALVTPKGQQYFVKKFMQNKERVENEKEVI